MPPLSTPPVNKTHTWILVLLFWILAISIFVAGYLITQNNAPKIIALTPTELQSQCTTAGFVDKTTITIDDSSTQTQICPTPAPTSKIYSDGLGSPIKFSYPIDWNVYTKSSIDKSGLTTIELSPLPLGDCLECGGYFGNVAIEFSIYHPWAQSNFPISLQNIIDNLTKSGITITNQTSTTLSSGILTTLTKTFTGPACDSPGCGLDQTADQIIYVKNGTTKTNGLIVSAQPLNFSGTPEQLVAATKAWQEIISSVTFE